MQIPSLCLWSFMTLFLFAGGREVKIQLPTFSPINPLPDSPVPHDLVLPDNANPNEAEKANDEPIVFGALQPHLNTSSESDSVFPTTNSTSNATDSNDSPRYCTSDLDCIRGSDCDSRLRICVYSIPIIRGKNQS